jgi:methylmalonyl-CoA/ethylmalonyl-CoA epimerase
MKVRRIDHLAICVRDMDASVRTMEAMGAELQFRRRNDATELESATFKWGNITVTLEHPLSERGPFAEFLRRHGEGIHHIGMDVEDIEQTIAELNGKEMRTVNPQLSGDVRHEALLHPKSGLGILWQLMEWQGEYREDLDARLEAAKRGEIEIPGATRPL